jgi:hypothetical protein
LAQSKALDLHESEDDGERMKSRPDASERSEMHMVEHGGALVATAMKSAGVEPAGRMWFFSSESANRVVAAVQRKAVGCQLGSFAWYSAKARLAQSAKGPSSKREKEFLRTLMEPPGKVSMER